MDTWSDAAKVANFRNYRAAYQPGGSENRPDDRPTVGGFSQRDFARREIRLHLVRISLPRLHLD